MQKRQVMLGAVGGIVLVAAMAAVFQYEGSRASGLTLGSRSFDVSWTTAEAAGPEASGTTAPGESSPGAIQVATANLTRAAFTLEWTDDMGSPDTFRLTVRSPTGDSRTIVGSSGALTLAFDRLNALPPTTTAFGDTEAQARARLASAYTRSAGAGEWTITVELTEAGGQTTPVGNLPLQPDPGNAWTLKSTLTTYAPALTPRN